MSSTTTIALCTLPHPPATAPPAPATPSTGANSNISGSGSQQFSLQSAAAPSPQPSTAASHSPPDIQVTAPAAIGNGSAQDGRPTWRQKAKPMLSMCGSVVKITIAVVGASWAIYIGLAGLYLQRWSARNDSLQSCLALGSRSKYCNTTIEAGVKPPPSWKRDSPGSASTMIVSSWCPAMVSSPSITAAAVAITVAAVVVAAVYFRPRMKPFHPVVSNVRLIATGVTNVVVFIHSIPWTEPFEGVCHPWLPLLMEITDITISGQSRNGPEVTDDPDVVFYDKEYDESLAKRGRRVGIFYESDQTESTDDSDDDVESAESRASDQVRSTDDDEDDVHKSNASDSDNDSGGIITDTLTIGSLQSVQHGKDHLTVTIDDLCHLQHSSWADAFWTVLKPRSKSLKDRVVAYPLYRNKRKEAMMRKASTEMLLRYMQALLVLHSRRRAADHLLLLFYWLGDRLVERGFSEIVEALLILTARKRLRLMMDVFEELSGRIAQKEAILHRGTPFEDTVGARLLRLYATSKFYDLQTATKRDRSRRSTGHESTDDWVHDGECDMEGDGESDGESDWGDIPEEELFPPCPAARRSEDLPPYNNGHWSGPPDVRMCRTFAIERDEIMGPDEEPIATKDRS